MSHFTCLVLFKDKPTPENLNDALEEQLAPYDENLSVAPYEEECWCRSVKVIPKVDNQLADEGLAWATIREAFGQREDVKALRVSLAEIEREDPAAESKKEMKRLDAEIDALWQAATRLTLARGKELTEQYNKVTPFDSGCEDCHGKGIKLTKYNPSSKWDWWTVGGRWSGALDGYDPRTDPENIEECCICHGTGMRNDRVGMEARASDPTYKCNGCLGKGERVKWPTQWKPYHGDVRMVPQIQSDFCPFAIITPDGVWHQQATMGWWGMTTNEDGDWETKAKEILVNHGDALAVLVDCHI